MKKGSFMSLGLLYYIGFAILRSLLPLHAPDLRQRKLPTVQVSQTERFKEICVQHGTRVPRMLRSKKHAAVRATGNGGML